MDDLPEDPRVSVVLCTYATDMFDHFSEAAESVLDQTYPDVELVVFVDGNDELCELVREEYAEADRVIIHCNEENRGLSFGRNKGVELASGDIVAFMDDDAVADEHWVAELVAAYRRHDALAVGGRMEPRWVAGRPDFLPEEFYWLIGVTYRGFPTEETEVRNTFSSNLSFRREAFQKIGAFETHLGKRGSNDLQGAETELCSRLGEKFGRGVIYKPEAVVEHKVFDFRTDIGWLVERAFWQGYSKRMMEDETPEAIGTEWGFLGQLLGTFIPQRVGGLLRRPSLIKVTQLVMFVVLLGAVGAGYAFGTVDRWR